jgi:four helix bundle protein
MALQTFENLEVWKRGCRLAVDLFVASQPWKDFSLRDQVRRSALSVPSNIPEGAERDAEGDFIRFLRIAKGSCGELRTQLYIANSIMQNTKGAVKISKKWITETKEISAMLQGLIMSIERRSNRTEH